MLLNPSCIDTIKHKNKLSILQIIDTKSFCTFAITSI